MSIQNDKLMNLADGKVLYDDLRVRVDDQVTVSDTEPLSETNKLWIDSSETEEYTIPTYAEHQALQSALQAKIDEPSTEGTSGQVLTTDGNGGRSWTTVQGGGGTVTDVQVNGTSVLSQGVANVPLVDSSTDGLVKAGGGGAVKTIAGNHGCLYINTPSDSTIKAGTNDNFAVGIGSQHKSVFYGLAKASGDTSQSTSSNAVGVYTENALSSIHQMLDAPVSVSGSTPSITAKPGVRYVCGEVSTLTIVLPASGCVDVTFESGSTATVLTITPPTGQTIKWANGFDPTSLDANTTYELNIMDGLGVAGSWT